MKIPYNKADFQVAIDKLPMRATAIRNENLAVLNFRSTASSPSEARKDALTFLKALLTSAIGTLTSDDLVEDVLAMADYSREYLDKPGMAVYTYRWSNVLIRQWKNSPAVELDLKVKAGV